MNKKKFSEAEIKVIRFESTDIIATSGDPVPPPLRIENRTGISSEDFGIGK